MQDDEFSWDNAKAATNMARGRPAFEAAKLVFRDTLALELGEDRRGYSEQRFQIIGRSGEKLLHVTFAYRGDLIHIISVRLAEQHERKAWLSSITHPKNF